MAASWCKKKERRPESELHNIRITISPNERPAPEDVEIYICRRSDNTTQRLSKEQKTSQYYLFECDLDKRTLFAGRKLALCRQPEQKIANKQIDRFVRQKTSVCFVAHTLRAEADTRRPIPDTRSHIHNTKRLGNLKEIPLLYNKSFYRRNKEVISI